MMVIFSVSFFAGVVGFVAIGSSLDINDDVGLIFGKSLLKVAIPAVIFSFLAGGFIPSEKTMYMIIASEMGEEVIQTEEMSKVLEILNNELDELLENPDE